MNLSELCFVQTVPLLDGSFGQRISSDQGYSMVREGDAVIVSKLMPENDDRGFPVKVTRIYNWNACLWAVPAAEVKSARK